MSSETSGIDWNWNESVVRAAYGGDNLALDLIHKDGWGDRTWEDNRANNPVVIEFERTHRPSETAGDAPKGENDPRTHMIILGDEVECGSLTGQRSSMFEKVDCGECWREMDSRKAAPPSPSDRFDSVERSGKLVLRLPKSIHTQCAKLAEKEGVSLNHWLSSSIAMIAARDSLGEKVVPQDRIEAIAADPFCGFDECSTSNPKTGVCTACDAIYAARECLRLRAALSTPAQGEAKVTWRVDVLGRHSDHAEPQWIDWNDGEYDDEKLARFEYDRSCEGAWLNSRLVKITGTVPTETVIETRIEHEMSKTPKALSPPVTLLILMEPPSGNHYVQHSRGRHFKTKAALAWYATVALTARGVSVSGTRHEVEYTVYQGHGSRGDVDNYAKCIMDGLTKAGVLKSDASVTDLIAHKRRDRDNPRTEITVREV